MSLRLLLQFARHHGSFRVGLIIVMFWLTVALIAPLAAPYGPTEPHPSDVLRPPNSTYLLGTDRDGMDILSRLMWAPRVDLGIAVTVSVLAILLGTPIGALAGYYSGRGGLLGLISEIIMRVTDVSMAFPVFILALALVAVLGASITNVIIALAFLNTPVFIWLTRSEVLSVREMAFVEAARCSGNTGFRLVFRHVLPNSLASPLTQFSVVLGFAVLMTAGLSFVGAGVPVPTPEWGLMVAQGATSMITGQWWPALFPGLALGSAVLGFALVGDGLRVFLDPRQRREVERGSQPGTSIGPIPVQRESH